MEVVRWFLRVLPGAARHAPPALAWLGGLVTTAADGFTASTSCADRAGMLARGLAATFAGIATNHVPAFAFVRLIGAALRSPR